MTKITFLKLLDTVLGRLFCFLLPQSPTSARLPQEVKSVLFIRPGGIGDAVLLLPVINIVKQTFPDVNIFVLAEKRNAAVFKLSRNIKAIYRYDAARELLSVFRKSYDVVVDSEQWHRLSAVVAKLINAKFSIGFDTNERRKCFQCRIAYSHNDSELASFYHLVSRLLTAKSIPSVEFVIPEDSLLKAKNAFGPVSTSKCVAIFPGGSISEKRWDKQSFREIAQLLSHKQYTIVLVGGENDFLDGEIIAENISGVLNFCGRLSLLETAAVISYAKLLITGDSGIMHIASGLGIKIVALFGPGSIQKWAPKNDNTVIVSKNLPCSPCSQFGYTPHCKNDVACMKLITVEEVYAKTVELLER